MGWEHRSQTRMRNDSCAGIYPNPRAMYYELLSIAAIIACTSSGERCCTEASRSVS